jgi:benzodiazapine receptor
MRTLNPWLALAAFLLLCYGVAFTASMVTTPAVASWYPGIRKPAWTPPNWLFGPMWTALYTAMAVAAWLVWRRAGWEGARGALTLFFAQLALNWAWSFLFFGARQTGWAAVEIVVLWAAIAATTAAFWPLSRTAGALLLPYLAWVGYAAALNIRIWSLNR